MSQSNYITLALFISLGLIFLIDYLKKRKEDSLEKSVEKFVEKEKTGKKSWLSLKTFFWLYPIVFVFFIPFIFCLRHPYVLMENLFFEKYRYRFIILHFFSLIPVGIIHYVYYRKHFMSLMSSILKRKKNISLSILIIMGLKIPIHYFLYDSCGHFFSGGGLHGRPHPNNCVEFKDFFSAIFSDYWHWYSEASPGIGALIGDGMTKYFVHIDARLDLFIPIIIVFLIVVWFFNDKIKAQ